MLIRIYKIEKCKLCDYIGDKIAAMARNSKLEIEVTTYTASKEAYSQKFPDIKTVPAVAVDAKVLHGKYIIRELRAALEEEERD